MAPLHMVPVATPYSKEQNLAKFYLDIEILFDRFFFCMRNSSLSELNKFILTYIYCALFSVVC